jgi:hypothetical protein
MRHCRFLNPLFETVDETDPDFAIFFLYSLAGHLDIAFSRVVSGEVDTRWFVKRQ